MTLYHGGRLRQAAATYGIAHADWLDLSAAINPSPWPAPTLAADIWQRLPDDGERLLQAAATYYGSDQLLAVNGSQQAINWLPWLRAPAQVLLFEPGYQEHAANWQAAGHRIEALPIEQRPEILGAIAAGTRPAPQVLVLINPHNPTGDVVDAATLTALHARVGAQGGWLIVDEAFADGLAAPSCIRQTMPAGLIVLRSTGKFFGLPGLRGGFVCAAPQLLARLAERIGPWPQSTAAQQLLPLAFADTRWQAQAVQQLTAASTRLRALLAAVPALVPAAGTLLFQTLRCASDEHARAIHHRLACQGILLRHYRRSPYLRVGLPADHNDWHRLQQALAGID